MGTQELAHGGIEGHQATLQGDLAVATLVGRWRRRRGQSAQTKHGDVVIDLDAWVRAIPASLCALIVAGERAPIHPGRSQKFIAAQRFAVSGAKVGAFLAKKLGLGRRGALRAPPGPPGGWRRQLRVEIPLRAVQPPRPK